MSRIFILFAFLTTTFFIGGATHKSFPTNDLWKEDVLNKSNAGEEVFSHIIDIAYDLYKPLADMNNESLTINKKWNDPTVNANCSRFMGTVTINMFGGLFRRQEITPEGFALVLCHEIGHAYGGTPYLSTWRKMSAEGQADYYGAKDCHHNIMDKLNLQESEVGPLSFIDETCDEHFTGKRYDTCVRGLQSGQSLANLLATIKKEDQPSYLTPDPTVVNETLLSYPATIQCRLDTYYAGVLQQSRPLCWFKP